MPVLIGDLCREGPDHLVLGCVEAGTAGPDKGVSCPYGQDEPAKVPPPASLRTQMPPTLALHLDGQGAPLTIRAAILSPTECWHGSGLMAGHRGFFDQTLGRGLIRFGPRRHGGGRKK